MSGSITLSIRGHHFESMTVVLSSCIIFLVHTFKTALLVVRSSVLDVDAPLVHDSCTFLLVHSYLSAICTNPRAVLAERVVFYVKSSSKTMGSDRHLIQTYHDHSVIPGIKGLDPSYGFVHQQPKTHHSHITDVSHALKSWAHDPWRHNSTLCLAYPRSVS